MPTNITQIDHIFTGAPIVPDIDIQTEEEYDDAARGWFYYWKNTILVEITSLVTKLNVFSTEVDAVVVDVNQSKLDTQNIYDNTLGTYNDTVAARSQTEGYRDETLAYINATMSGAFDIGGWTAGLKDTGVRTTHKGSLWLSNTQTLDEPTRASTDWIWLAYVENIIEINANHIAKEGDVIFVDPTAIGNNITITVPDTFSDLSVLRIINTDSINTNILYVVPETVIPIDGDTEGVEVSCPCDVSYVKYSNKMIRR